MGAEYHLTNSIDSERSDESNDLLKDSSKLLETEESGFIRRASKRGTREYIHLFILYLTIILLLISLFVSNSISKNPKDLSQQVWCKYLTNSRDG